MKMPFRELMGSEASDAVHAHWVVSIVPRLSPKASRKLDGTGVVELFKRDFFDGDPEVGSWYQNAEILALAILLISHDFELPELLTNLAGKAIGIELLPQSLSEWKSPAKRKKELERLANQLGVADPHALNASVSRVGSGDPDEIDILKAAVAWLESPEVLEKEYPTFLNVVDRVVRAKCGFEYDDRFQNIIRNRMGMLAFYVGRSVDLDREEILKLMRRAVEKAYL